MDILLDNQAFCESPRWRDGWLYYSDFYDQCVWKVNLLGQKVLITKLDDQPSGLGWLPDKSLLVVSMRKRKVLRVCHHGNQSTYADFSNLTKFNCNDMVVDNLGRAYVGNFGYRNKIEDISKSTNLFLVNNKQINVLNCELTFPNGMVIFPNGKTLVVAETYAHRLSAFDIDTNGTLKNKRLWAQLPTNNIDHLPTPDGICLDAEGAIWVASPNTYEVLRLQEGGEVIDKISLDTKAFACMLGGSNRLKLFIFTNKTSNRQKCLNERSGKILVTDVNVPGVGLP